MNIYDEIERKTSLFLHTPIVSQQPSSLPTDIIFPTSTQFNTFYDETTFFKTELKFELKKHTITITGHNGHTIDISLYAIILLLSDKFKSKVAENIDIKDDVNPLPDIEMIDNVLNNKIFWIKDSFDKIMSYNDQIIRSASHEYHATMSIPLILRIRLLEFEKSLTAQKIVNEIKIGLEKKAEEVESIRKDYEKKFTTEKVNYRTSLEKYRIELERLRVICDHLKNSADSYKSKVDLLNEDITKNRQKLTDAESKAESLERTLSDTKIKLTRAEQELKKYKSAEWTLSITSTAEKPIFIADTGDPETTKIIEFPAIDDFKENFKVATIEGDTIIYKAGNRKVEVPISLEQQYPKLIEKLVTPTKSKSLLEPKETKPPKTTTSTKKLASNPMKVRDALKNVHPEGMTMQEAAEAARVQYSNMSTYMSKLKNADQIEERDAVGEDGRKITKYYYKQ